MKILIVIDMQNDFVTGVLGSKEAVAVLPNVKKKIDAYIAAGDEVIFTRDTHEENYLETNEGRHLPVPHCVKETEGWQVVKEIDCPDGEHINKPTFGYIHWAEQFKDSRVSGIEIIGVCTDICVISNALSIQLGTGSGAPADFVPAAVRKKRNIGATAMNSKRRLKVRPLRATVIAC